MFGGALADGAILGMSDFYNSMIMEFTMVPAGIGKVIKDGGTGIVVDITRQMEWKDWKNFTRAGVPTGPPTNDEDFPVGDIANDDTPPPVDENGLRIARDEDVDFYNDNGVVSDTIYVRDMPGWPTADAGSQARWVVRHNMLEFVRLKFDGSDFTTDNEDETVEGSRASGKIAWHSRIDIVNDFSGPDEETGKWDRNTAATAVNDIGLGAINVDLPAL